jgi:hypothetical protein
VHALHRRAIDHEPAFAHRVAGDVVAAAAHGEQQVVRPCETDGVHDVRRPFAPDDQRRSLVDHLVPHLARRVVGGIAPPQQIAAQAGAELLDCGCVDCHVSSTSAGRPA